MSQPLGYVGKKVPRIEALEKVTGQARYTADLMLPGLMVGKMVRSPHPHARVKEIRLDKTLALPGVKGAVTIKEVPRAAGGMWDLHHGTLFIRDDKVRFIGEPVVALAAVDEDVAEEAASLVEIDYEVLPSIFDPKLAMEPDAAQLYETGNIKAVIPMMVGDVETGFKGADHIFEHSYVTSKVKPCPLEPASACIAEYGLNGRLTLWSPTQRPHEIKVIVAAALEIPAARVRVIKPHTGGAFGSRDGPVFSLETMTAALAMRVGGPVIIRFSRREEFIGTDSRHPCIISVKTGLKSDGRITAREMKFIANTGAYATHAVGITAVAGMSFLRMYPCPNMKFEGTIVHTNDPLSGAFRGYGNSQANFAIESQMDEIAHALGLDPLDFRLQNSLKQGDVDPASSFRIETCGLEECIRKGAERIGWGTNQSASNGKLRGQGMACVVHNSGAKRAIPDAASAIVKVNEDGSVNLLTSASDDGQGMITVFAQIVADLLGVKVEAVTVSSPDTDVTPFDVGTYASRQAYVGGNAVKEAALRAKEKILEAASDKLNVPPDKLELGEGRVFSLENPETSMGLSELMMALHFGPEPYQIIGTSSTEAPSNALAFGAQFVDLEVDPGTGQVSVLKVVAAHDVGKALNVFNVEGQIEGGVQQGLGYALTEEVVLREGEVLNPGFTDYKMLTSWDMPVIETILVETEDPTGPFGAKGVGEPPIIPTPAAVANALFNAVGIRFRELPMTQEKVFNALKSRKKS